MGRRTDRAHPERTKPRTSFGRWLFRILLTVTVTVAVGSIALTWGTTLWAKALHGDAKALVVTSNSMVPVFEARDILAIKPINPNDLKVGDVVTLKRANGTTVTHRVVALQHTGGTVFITTKGDANPVKDPDVATGAQVVGVYDGQIPPITLPHFGQVRLGQAFMWAATARGRILTLAPSVLLFVAWEVVDLWRKPEDDEDSPLDGATRTAAGEDAATEPFPALTEQMLATLDTKTETAERATPLSKKAAKAAAKAAAKQNRRQQVAAKAAAEAAAQATKARRRAGDADPDRPVYRPVVDPSKPRGRHRAGGRAPRRH